MPTFVVNASIEIEADSEGEAEEMVQAMDIVEWDGPVPIPYIELKGVTKLNA